MRFLFLLTSAALAVCTTADDTGAFKQVDASFVERQKKVLDILTGLTVHNLDSKYHHDHHEIFFNKPELFTNPKAIEDFMRFYKRGFVPRDSVFTLNDYKARPDTFKLFGIMFFAKDFDTFIDIAKWAKHELNAMQFSYAFGIAVLQRADCRGMYLPPSYEIFPHYYVPAHVMHQANIAALHDVENRVFAVNNTGHEYSWYSDMINGFSKTNARWRGDDMESRLSYFREDPGFSHWYSTVMAKLATWLTPKRYPGVNYIMRGKSMYSIHKWMLSRYNLERLAAGVPFVTPFDWDKETMGYNPGLTDNLGYPFVSRPDHMVPSAANPAGFSYLAKIEDRIAEAIDNNVYWNFKNESLIEWDDKTGVDILGKIIFGERDGIGRYYYKPWFFIMMETINDMIHSSNERDYTNTAFGKLMTAVRDPMFYQVLASMDDWFQTYFSHQKPYSSQQLGFPGVKVHKVEFSKLTTFFERWEYEITHGVPFKKPEDYVNKKYMVSHQRINHKPFTFNITVESERPQDAMVRVYFGPKSNIGQRDMSLNQARHAYYMAALFPQKLKAGVNVISKSSDSHFYFYEKHEPFRAFNERMAKSVASGKPFSVNTMVNCGCPQNLMLPRGKHGGREYSVFVLVEPIHETTSQDNAFYHCSSHKYMDQPHITFPFDRPIPFTDTFKQPNMYFDDIMVYHKKESDFNRPEHYN